MGDLIPIDGMPGIAKLLRELADKADAGEIDHIVVAAKLARKPTTQSSWAGRSTLVCYGLVALLRNKIDWWFKEHSGNTA